MNNVLGAQSQGTRHAPADLSTDISELMKSLDEHDVYRLSRGRVLDDDDAPAKDVVSIGLQMLTDSATSPLDEYNTAFTRLQRRRRRVPLVGAPQQPSRSTIVQPTHPMDITEDFADNSDSDSTRDSDSESDSTSSLEGEDELELTWAEDDGPTLTVEEEDDVALDLDDLDLEQEAEGGEDEDEAEDEQGDADDDLDDVDE